MNLDRVAELPALLRSLADDVAALPDFTDLPRVANVQVEWDKDGDTLKLRAQLFPRDSRDDLAIIADLNQWAAALGGHLLLGEEVAAPDSYWRSIAATAALPGGFLIEVWTHLYYQIPTGALSAVTRLLTAA